MRCSNCKTENPPGKKFCGDCGAPLANLCPKCGADNPAGKRFCGECGTALGLAAAAPASIPNDSPIRVADAPAPENLEGERKTVTALFADIKGSTELEQDLDPEEARAIVDPALRLMIDAVRRYDGYVVQSTGAASSRSSARPSRTKTIRSAHCMQLSACRKNYAATATSCSPTVEHPSRFAWA